MDNFFLYNPLGNVQFFSVVNSLMIVGELLHNETKSQIERKQESIWIINLLCEFLTVRKENEILNLGHGLLRNTELYGSRENETLDIRFVTAMFDSMIANIIFSKFGNTFGYLAAMVNTTTDLRLSSIKERITKNLERQKFLNMDGKFSQLSNYTRTRIMENLINPLFPESKENLKIIHFKYIYAQAGWTILRSVGHNSVSFNFHLLITLALNVEQQVIRGEIDSSALQIFQLPALLFYTHHHKKLKVQSLKSLIISTKFWNNVYNYFFTNLNNTEGRINFLLKQSPVYNFQKAFAEYKTRGNIAEEILMKNCPNETNYEDKVTDYKNNPNDYYCTWGGMKMKLPDLNQLFQKQNQMIGRKYFSYEKYLINQTFDDNLKKFINQGNVSIKPIFVSWKQNCFRCGKLTNRPILSEGIDLFQIEGTIYALIRSKNGMRLLPSDKMDADKMDSFLNQIGLNSRANLGLPFDAEEMDSKNFSTFSTYIAKKRSENFYNSLQTQGYEATIREHVINFLLHLIPFYSCSESISTGTAIETTVNCALDSLILLPIFGEFLSVTLKFSTATRTALILSLGLIAKTKTLNEMIKLSLQLFATEFIQFFKTIITKTFIENLFIKMINVIDPGINFLVTLSKQSVKMLMKIYKKLNIKENSKFIFKRLTTRKIDIFDGYDVFVSSLTGRDGFGMRKISYKNELVVLRRLQGYASEMPVIVIGKSIKERPKYRIINLKTGKIGKIEWEESNGILRIVEKPLAVRLKMIQTEGLSGRGAIGASGNNLEWRTTIYDDIERERNLASNKAYFPPDREILYDFLKKFVLTDENNDQKNFAIYWLKYNSFPSWSKNCELLDVQLYENLRFSTYIEDVDLNREKAITSIQERYDTTETKVLNIDLNELYNFYTNNKLHSEITFADQFALANYIHSGFSTIHHDNFDTWSMKQALYKTAIRQYDNSMIFKLVERDFLYTNEHIITNQLYVVKGKIIHVERFTILKGQIDELVSNTRYQLEKPDKVHIVHKIELRQQFLAIRMKKYLPIATNDVVLLPGVSFKLSKWVRMEVGGQKILVVTWNDIDIDRGKWLAETSNNVKRLIDQEQEGYDLLDDFDVNSIPTVLFDPIEKLET